MRHLLFLVLMTAPGLFGCAGFSPQKAEKLQGEIDELRSKYVHELIQHMRDKSDLQLCQEEKSEAERSPQNWIPELSPPEAPNATFF